MQRGYRTDGTARTNICGNASRSDPCDPALLTLTNNSGGNYTVKVLADAGTDSRYLFRVGAGSDRETRVYFYGDFPASPLAAAAAVSAEACTNCHGPEGIDVHGGYYAAVDGAEPCLTCHGVDVISLGEAAHKYHSSLWVDDGEVVEITYPTYMLNCSVCHNEAPQLAAVNAMPVSGAGCFTCHGGIDGWDFTGPPDLTFHLTIMDPETADCTVCHDGAVAPAIVADFHNGLAPAFRRGPIFNGEDVGVVEGAKFDWQITGIVDDGTDLAISWVASYDGVGVDPCNDTVDATVDRGNRIDNAGMCILCHNSAANEQNVRTATMGIGPADTYDGEVGETYELKTMLHRIHSAGEDGSPIYVIYRGRGVYAFAPDDSLLPN